MKKKLLFILPFIFSCGAFAGNLECEFTPTETKVGEIGNNESKLFVCESAWSCYYLGKYNEDIAKLRYSTAMTALASGKRLRLRYYNQQDCNIVKSNYIAPNSVWLRK